MPIEALLEKNTLYFVPQDDGTLEVMAVGESEEDTQIVILSKKQVNQLKGFLTGPIQRGPGE